MEKYIAIAADSVAALRKSDVYRVLEWADQPARAALAQYITAARPDLSGEVADCLADL